MKVLSRIAYQFTYKIAARIVSLASRLLLVPRKVATSRIVATASAFVAETIRTNRHLIEPVRIRAAKLMEISIQVLQQLLLEILLRYQVVPI